MFRSLTMSFTLAALGCASHAGGAPETGDGSAGHAGTANASGGSGVTGGAQAAGASAAGSNAAGTANASGGAATGGNTSGGSSGSAGDPGSAGGSGDVVVPAEGCTSTQEPGTWDNVTPPTMKMSGDFIDGPITVGVDPVKPSNLYVHAQYDGTWKSEDCGVTWTKVSTGTNGDAAGNGRQWYAAIDRNPNRDPGTAPTLYVTLGYGSGGIWKSSNGGVDWTNVWNNNIFDTDGTTDISSDVGGDVTGVMLVDDSGPDHVIAFLHGYWGSGDNNGVFESTDGGGKWVVHTADQFGFHAHGDVVFPYDAQTWIVNHGTAWPNSVFYRTTDGGGSWSLLDGSVEGGSICRAYVIRGSSIYCGSDYTSGLFASHDQGASWARLGDFGKVSWATATQTTLYAASNQGDTAHVFSASVDDDTSWSEISVPSEMKGNGSQTPGVLYDGLHYVIVAAQEGAGLWRYVEP